MGLKEFFKKQYKDTTESKNTKLTVESNSPIIEGAFTKEYLGLGIYDSSLAQLVDIGSRVPIEKSYIFSTYEDGQDQIILKLYRSAELEVEKAFALGQFQIIGIPSMPAREPQIEVKFSVDERNIYIGAKDMKSGNYLEIIKIFQN